MERVERIIDYQIVNPLFIDAAMNAGG
jgi:hypothetical protein